MATSRQKTKQTTDKLAKQLRPTLSEIVDLISANLHNFDNAQLSRIADVASFELMDREDDYREDLSDLDSLQDQGFLDE